MKHRLDKVMVERRLAATRSRARELIASAQVTVDRAIVTKPAFSVGPEQIVALAHGEEVGYVSRGGIKLAAALDAWNIDISGRICLDIGISTGGFTDCLLQRGALSITGIDTGHDQLAEKLRRDPRVRLLERTNARFLTPDVVPAEVTFFAMDVSFIAAALVLPAVIAAAFPVRDAMDRRQAVVLVKPQFEAGRRFVGKNGIVRDAEAHRIAMDRVRQTVQSHGAVETRVMESPIVGGAGNREFLLYARF